jgi:uncharacterized membrane protein (DUF485 family)
VNMITIRQTRDSLHRKAPADRVPALGAFDSSDPVVGGPMSFAPFASLAVIIGVAVVVLAAVVGYGYYSFAREFFDKPDAYEP